MQAEFGCHRSAVAVGEGAQYGGLVGPRQVGHTLGPFSASAKHSMSQAGPSTESAVRAVYDSAAGLLRAGKVEEADALCRKSPAEAG